MLHIDFGPSLGIRKSSAQITERYDQAMPMAEPITVAIGVRDAEPGDFHKVLGKGQGA